MIQHQNTVVVGIFAQPTQAKSTIEELRRVGYRERAIRLLPHTNRPESEDRDLINVASSASGAAIGSLLGALSASFMPGIHQNLFAGVLLTALGVAIVGALIGNIVGTFTTTGTPLAQEAQYYRRERENGRCVVLVKWPTDHERIYTIMNQHGALTCQRWAG